MKNLFQYLSLVVASLSATCALCEAVLRLLPPPGAGAPPLQEQQKGFMRQEQRTGWLPQEGAQVELVNASGVPFMLRINSTGQRGGELPERAPGERRLLFLGDSFTMGTQVREEATFAAQADSLLPEQVRVINCGVDGYNTYQELAYYRYFGRPLEPDIVVLCFFPGNDFRDNMVNTNQGRLLNPVLIPLPLRFWGRRDPVLRDQDGRPLRDPVSGTAIPASSQEWIKSLERRFLLARLIGSRYARLKGVWLGDLELLDLDNQYFFYEIGFYQRRDTDLFQTARELTLECLERLSQMVSEDGAEFAVAILPSQNQVAPPQWQRTLEKAGLDEDDLGVIDMAYPNRLIGEFCTAHSIPFLDLSVAFSAAVNPGDLYLTAIGDLHFSAAGHHLAGVNLAAWITQHLTSLGEPAADSYREGLRRMRTGDLTRALQALNTAAGQRPNWAAPYLSLGELYTLTAQWERSRAAYSQATTVAPGVAKAWEGLAGALAKTGDVPGSIAALEQAMHLEPTWWPYRERLAQLYAQMGRDQESQANQDQVQSVFNAPRLTRQFWWAEHTSRAIEAMRTGKEQLAEQEFERAIRFVPDEPTSLYNLGWLYQRSEQRDRALALYRRITELAPDFYPARQQLEELSVDKTAK